MQELLDDNWGKEESVPEYNTAPIGYRLAAFFIDTFVFLGIIFLLEAGIKEEEVYVGALWMVLLATVGATAARKQVGLGKKLLKIEVVHIEGQPLHWFRIVVRTAFKHFFIFNPIIFGIITFIAQTRRKDPQQMFFHDVVTKTKVVKAINHYKKEEQLGIIKKT